MWSEIKKYSNALNNFNKDRTETWFSGHGTTTYVFRESLSYSWDFGDIHHIQLHNYPMYTVNLNASGTIVKIAKSLDWLKKI